MKSLMSVFLLVMFSLPLRAANDGAELRVKAVLGNRDTRFLVKNLAGKITIEMVMEAQYSRTRELKEKEWEFIISEFERLPMPRKVPPECDHHRMDIVFSAAGREQIKASCIGVKSITSPSYARFAQLLALAFE